MAARLEATSTSVKKITLSEIQTHNTDDDCWLVVEGKTYDATRWADHHPGGRRILSYHAGRDATEFFNAFHKDKTYVLKFLKPLYLGQVEGYTRSELFEDFTALTEKAKEMDLFTPSFTFYALMLMHVFLLEIIAYLVVLVFGTWWLPFSVSVFLQSIYVMQGSWLQHDYGHGSPCKSRFWQKVFHYITGSLIMGFSPKWWNDLHFRHHSKPNVITKDPDLNLGPFYVQGEAMAKEAAQEWNNPLPFHRQHLYFFALGPPILLSVLMQLSCCVFMVANKCWLDIIMGSLCFLRYYYLYEPLLGFRWMFIMFACMSLFPTMPRHNLHKITPYVKALCDKHHITYTEKSMSKAMLDIIRSLKSYGEVWKKTKMELHAE